MKKHIIKLKKLEACQEAIDYAKGFETLQDAWDACERGDWMLWFIGKQAGKPGSEKRKLLVLTACKCARLSLKYVAKGEKRPLKAIETAEGWARGENTLDEVMRATDSADVAYAAFDAAADAAYSAADAAYAAAHAAASAYSAADAAYAAAHAAAGAAADVAYAADAAYAASAANAASAASAANAAKKDTLKKCANIVRENYPKI